MSEYETERLENFKSLKEFVEKVEQKYLRLKDEFKRFNVLIEDDRYKTFDITEELMRLCKIRVVSEKQRILVKHINDSKLSHPEVDHLFSTGGAGHGAVVTSRIFVDLNTKDETFEQQSDKILDIFDANYNDYSQIVKTKSGVDIHLKMNKNGQVNKIILVKEVFLPEEYFRSGNRKEKLSFYVDDNVQTLKNYFERLDKNFDVKIVEK